MRSLKGGIFRLGKMSGGQLGRRKAIVDAVVGEGEVEKREGGRQLGMFAKC